MQVVQPTVISWTRTTKSTMFVKLSHMKPSTQSMDLMTIRDVSATTLTLTTVVAWLDSYLCSHERDNLYKI